MKFKNVLSFVLLTSLVLAFGCNGTTETVTPTGPTIPTYTVDFIVQVCDEGIDQSCQDDNSLQVVPSADIYLYDSQEKRDAGQQEIAKGVTTISGTYAFSGLEAGDYFYTVIHPSPNLVEGNGVEQLMVRISPNTSKVVAEVLFFKE